MYFKLSHFVIGNGDGVSSLTALGDLRSATCARRSLQTTLPELRSA